MSSSKGSDGFQLAKAAAKAPNATAIAGELCLLLRVRLQRSQSTSGYACAVRCNKDSLTVVHGLLRRCSGHCKPSGESIRCTHVKIKISRYLDIRLSKSFEQRSCTRTSYCLLASYFRFAGLVGKLLDHSLRVRAVSSGLQAVSFENALLSVPGQLRRPA